MAPGGKTLSLLVGGLRSHELPQGAIRPSNEVTWERVNKNIPKKKRVSVPDSASATFAASATLHRRKGVTPSGAWKKNFTHRTDHDLSIHLSAVDHLDNPDPNLPL